MPSWPAAHCCKSPGVQAGLLRGSAWVHPGIFMNLVNSIELSFLAFFLWVVGSSKS